MSFADYTKLVLQDFEKKRAANKLSLRLSQPTTNRLKEECIAVCTKRYSRRDGRALNLFFEEGDDPAALLKKIEKCDPDKLRPLLNYLKGKTATTDSKNVELLAWLIDFDPRPFELGRRYDINVPETPVMEGEMKKGGNEEGNKPASLPVSVEEEATVEGKERGGSSMESTLPKSSPGFKMPGTIIAIVLLALLGGAVYWAGKNKTATIPMGQSLTGPEACMYWAGDHYEQVSCGQKRGDTLIVALDPEKLSHFRKITRPDTITKNDKGRVWYLKINGAIEFYTAGGYHPVDQRLRLKPITDYIIRKYIRGDLE